MDKTRQKTWNKFFALLKGLDVYSSPECQSCGLYKLDGDCCEEDCFIKKVASVFTMQFLQPCDFCDNGRLNDDLDDDNDLFYCGIGDCVDGYRIMLGSGDGKPLRIEFDRWDEKVKIWVTVGCYFPKNCPECGREIFEYGDIKK